MPTYTDEEFEKIMSGGSQPSTRKSDEWMDSNVFNVGHGKDTRLDQSLVRGIVNSPARFVQGLESLRDYSLPSQAQKMPHFGDAIAARTEPLADQFAPPGTRIGSGLAERIGEQAIPAAIGMAGAGAIGGMPAALAEGALAVATPVVGATAEAAGMSPEQAALAEMITAAAGPSVAVRALRGMGYRGTQFQPEMHRVSANRMARDMVPGDETGGGLYYERAADALDASQRPGVSPFDQQTSEMVLSEAAPNFENLAIRKAQTDSDFNARMGGRKLRLGDLQDQRVEAAIGSGPVEPASSIRQTFKTQQQSAKAANDALWKQLDLNGEPPASDVFIRRAIDDITEEAGIANKDALPRKQINQIEEMNGKIPWSELQAIRSRLGAQVDASRSPGASDVVRIKGRYASRLREAIDETIENASPDLATRYPDAIASHRRYKTVFDRKSKAFRALDSQEDGIKMVREIMDSRDAVPEAARVVEMLGDDPNALNDFRKLVAVDTFQPEVGPTSPQGVKSRYLKRREAMSRLWDEADIAVFDELADAGISASVGKAGRRGMNYGAGSSTTTPDASGFIQWLKKTLRSQITGGDRMTNRVLENYLMNPKELAPVLRDWKAGNIRDAGMMVFSQVAKSALRTAAYPAHQSLEVETPLPDSSR